MALVKLWDFDDATTQGWVIDNDNAALESGNPLNDTYGIKFHFNVGRFGTNTFDIMHIDLDLSTISNGIITLMIYGTGHTDGMFKIYIDVKIVDTSTGNTVRECKIPVYVYGYYWSSPYIYKNIVSMYVGGGLPSSGRIIISVIVEHNEAVAGDVWLDNIALYDGGDATYILGGIGFAGEASYVEYSSAVSVPSTVAQKNLGVAFMPDYNGSSWSGLFNNIDVTVKGSDSLGNSITIKLASGSRNEGVGGKGMALSNGIASVNDVKIVVQGKNLTGVQEEFNGVAVVVMDSEYKPTYLIVYIVRWTLNAIDPPEAIIVLPSPVNTAKSGSASFTLQVQCSKFDLTPVAVYVAGSNASVTTGSITVSVVDSGGNTLGSSTLDLTSGTTVTGSAITGLPGGQQLTVNVNVSITANAPVTIALRFDLTITAV